MGRTKKKRSTGLEMADATAMADVSVCDAEVEVCPPAEILVEKVKVSDPRISSQMH